MAAMSANGLDLETVDKLLTTTRATRKRLDLTRSVPLAVVKECLALALQAPNTGNHQPWGWMIVSDPEKRRALADIYQTTANDRMRRVAGERARSEMPSPHHDRANTPAFDKVMASVRHLIEHIHDVPLFVIPCAFRASRVGAEDEDAVRWAASIYPATWSLMLALRSRGLGSVITTAHLDREREVAGLLGIPDGYAQACLLPIAYYSVDDFKPAVRRSLDEVVFLDGWGDPATVG